MYTSYCCSSYDHTGKKQLKGERIDFGSQFQSCQSTKAEKARQTGHRVVTGSRGEGMQAGVTRAKSASKDARPAGTYFLYKVSPLLFTTFHG